MTNNAAFLSHLSTTNITAENFSKATVNNISHTKATAVGSHIKMWNSF